jgi:nucleoside-diphosphate-sugar epimerase
VNGFIGHSLVERILRDTDWRVYGMDIGDHHLAAHVGHERFTFLEGDISINHEWIEYHIKKCDVVLPLVAIATPMSYIRSPIEVFELDFEQNLRIVRQALRYGTRVVFPSTSEIYGMASDREFNEETTSLVLGPINKQRWIYSCAKQLLDRVIYAYGQTAGMEFTLFRPFNWIGPNLDDPATPKEGSSRVVSQFLGHLLRGEPLRLVDGGRQRRSFTYIDDGIDALMRIIANERGVARGRIFNLGNPANDCSIRELAELMIDVLADHRGFERIRSMVTIEEVSSEEYYGSGYQDMQARVPDITNARLLLGWEPRVELRAALARTIRFYLACGTEERYPRSPALSRAAAS